MDGSNFKERDPQDPRESIVAEAMELFRHYGYSKTNIGDIARASGMSPGNLYRYFKNKQAIGHAVVDIFLREEEAKVAPIVADMQLSAEQRLRSMLTVSVMHTIDHLRENPKIVELSEMICDTDEGIELICIYVEACHARLAGVIRAGAESGEFNVADVDDAARAVQMGTKFFHVPFAIARHGLDQVEHDLALTLDLLCAGLRGGAPRP